MKLATWILGVAMAVAVWLWVRSALGDDARAENGVHAPTGVPVTNADAWVPKDAVPTRIEFVAESRLLAGGAVDANSPALVGIESLGPLSGSDLEELRRNVASHRRVQEARLAEFSAGVQVGDLAQIHREAQLLSVVQISIAAEEAVAKGHYLTIKPPRALSMIPGCEVLATSAPMGAGYVNVAVVMPVDNYPLVREARAYQKEASQTAARELAYQFNGRDDAERAAMIARYRDILRRRKAGETISYEEVEFLHRQMGYSLPVHFDAKRNWMVAPK